MKKKIIYISLLLVISMVMVSAELPTRGQTNWDVPLNEYLNESMEGNGTLRDGIVESRMLNEDITLSVFEDDVGYLTGMPDSWNSESNAVYIQPGVDSTGRVRFFQNTTGSPLLSGYGYNPVTESSPWWYLGMFNYTRVDGYMRTILGASGGYDDVAAKIEIQSPYQVRITGVDSIIDTANVRIAASTDIQIHPRTVAETDSIGYLIIDTVGEVRGADVELSTNAGDLVLNPAGDVMVDGGYTGTCAAGTDIIVVGGIITGCV